VQHFDRVHRVKGNEQVQIVMRGLAVVDAEAVNSTSVCSNVPPRRTMSPDRLPCALFEEDDASWRSSSCSDSIERS